ncbi:MAG: hypothetical protein N2517_03085 [Ignavibacteria bacterium]|nr:hypothetical protein [Ignavibacteria bacterium]
MGRFLAWSCFILFLFALNIYAQEDDNLGNIQFEETNIPTEKPQYFGVGGGFIGSLLFIKLEDVNSLVKAWNLKEFKSPTFMSGAQGFTAIGIIPNLRVGFSGLSSTNRSEEKFGDTIKGVEFGLTATAFAIDYGFIPFKSFAVLPGLNFGWSGIALSTYKVGKISWDDLKQEKFSSNLINGSFWYLEPNLKIEFAATPFLMLRLGAGYSFSFSPKWSLNGVSEIKNVPSSIKPEGFLLNFGVFIGLFNY